MIVSFGEKLEAVCGGLFIYGRRIRMWYENLDGTSGNNMIVEDTDSELSA